MDASCFIQASIHGLSYFIVSRILGTYHLGRLFLFAFKQYLNDIANKYS